MFGIVNRRVPWHRLPPALGLVNLSVLRDELREKNLHDTSRIPGHGGPKPEPWRPELAARRTSDGTYNDLSVPAMGCAGARFGRNVPLDRAYPEAEPGLLDPSPRVVSTRLLARREFVPAKSLNLLAAAWIQFMTHNWFAHADATPGGEIRVPLDGRGDPWPESPMRIRRTPPDPTRRPGGEGWAAHLRQRAPALVGRLADLR